MKRINYQIFVLAFCFVGMLKLNAQEVRFSDSISEGYGFNEKNAIPTTSVKDQHRSGTCWSFAATSFVETEILRISDISLDLSEMYFVRYAYEGKVQDYVRRHGKANFGGGGQAHDVTNVIADFGFLPETVYPGLKPDEFKHNHGEMDAILSAFAQAVIKNSAYSLSVVWLDAYKAILDVYLGAVPATFQDQGNTLSPITYANQSGFVSSDYIELTSYSCYPWYKPVNLQIPDNWSYDTYYNLPLDDLMDVINYALENGYSVCWDGDVSSKGFSHRNGVAIVPEEEIDNLQGTEQSRWEAIKPAERMEKLYAFTGPVPEKNIDDVNRLEVFDNYTSTDDHLMHLVGVVLDKDGNTYYKTKNSWDTDSNKFGGYLNMSEAYVRLNTVAIMIHKDALPKSISRQIMK